MRLKHYLINKLNEGEISISHIIPRIKMAIAMVTPALKVLDSSQDL